MIQKNIMPSKSIEIEKTKLLLNKKLIHVEDFGAGSKIV